MENFVSTVAGLSARQRIVGALALISAVAAFVMILRIATQPGMALLYSGLDAGAAGEVVQALEQQGVAYEVRGGAIYVEGAQRDSLRMTLAAEGKPANGPAGYELLDSLSGFGTTSQMFDAAYWRAKEGELSRTIMSSPQIRAARVHISDANQRPFARDSGRGASVTVFPVGESIPPAQARALKYLVASAVAGLESDAVSIIDGRIGRIVGIDEETGAESGDLRAAELRRKAERILEARVGPGNAVVEVSVETVQESEQIRERRVDPDSRVMISSDTEERATASTDSRSAAVTVASNLPDGDAGDTGAQSSSDNTETRERVNYEVSETLREVVRTPGAIARVTVAVLVNLPVAPEGDTGAPVGRDAQELEALRELVASAVGFDEARGDVITIRAMRFKEFEIASAPVTGLLGHLAAGLDIMRLLQLATLAIVALVLGLFVVRPIFTRPPMPGIPHRLPSGAAPDRGSSAPGALPPPLSGDAERSAPRQISAGSNTAQRLVDAVGSREDAAAALLKGWMQEGSGA